MNFHETDLGKQFFTLHIPQLIEALRAIAAALKQPAAIDRLPDLAAGENDILSAIYYHNYMPESMERRENDPYNTEVKKALDPLMKVLTPEQRELFYNYEFAENNRGSSVACRAYKDGIRLAVQVIMAGCAIPVHTGAGAQPDCKPREAEDGNLA